MAATVGVGFHIEVTVFVELPLVGLVANPIVFLPIGRAVFGPTFGLMTCLVTASCGVELFLS